MSDDDQFIEYDSEFWEERNEVRQKFWYIIGVAASAFIISGVELVGSSLDYTVVAIISAIVLAAGMIWIVMQ